VCNVVACVPLCNILLGASVWQLQGCIQCLGMGEAFMAACLHVGLLAWQLACVAACMHGGWRAWRLACMAAGLHGGWFALAAAMHGGWLACRLACMASCLHDRYPALRLPRSGKLDLYGCWLVALHSFIAAGCQGWVCCTASVHCWGGGGEKKVLQGLRKQQCCK
jgi:hypothetical protein